MRKEALDTVYELAKINKKIIFIGSDLGHETLKEMRKSLPDQFFMEGISEQHIVGFAAGLAMEGYVPFINTIANFFSRRALEQIILDVALHNLPVKFLASGGGMVYAPLGPTHTATDDLAHLLTVPKLRVYAPCDAKEMTEIILFESEKQGPAYVRFGKGDEKIISVNFSDYDKFSIKTLGDINSEYMIVTTGITTHIALEFVNKISTQLKPLLVHLTNLNICEYAEFGSLMLNKKKILIIEEHQTFGGLLTQFLHFAHSRKIRIDNISNLSLPFQFIHNYGSQKEHFDYWGLSVRRIKEWWED